MTKKTAVTYSLTNEQTKVCSKEKQPQKVNVKVPVDE